MSQGSSNVLPVSISICHNRAAKEQEVETFRHVFLQFAIVVDGWRLSYDVAAQIALAEV